MALAILKRAWYCTDAAEMAAGFSTPKLQMLTQFPRYAAWPFLEGRTKRDVAGIFVSVEDIMNNKTENGTSMFKSVGGDRDLITRDPVTYARITDDHGWTDLKGKKAVEFPLSTDTAAQVLTGNSLTGNGMLDRWTGIVMGPDGELLEGAYLTPGTEVDGVNVWRVCSDQEVRDFLIENCPLLKRIFGSV